jgi:hypothetical protein
MPAARTPTSSSARSCTRRHAALHQLPRHHRERPRPLGGFEQEYFLYKDGRPLGFPKDGYPSTRRALLLRRRLQVHGQHRPQIVEEHLELCSPPASTTKASTPKSPRASGSSRSSPRAPPRPPTTSGRALPDDAPLREVRGRRGAALQAHQGRLERLRHALQLLDQVHARSGRQGVLRGADEGLRRTSPRTSRSTARTTTCA